MTSHVTDCFTASFRTPCFILSPNHTTSGPQVTSTYFAARGKIGEFVSYIASERKGHILKKIFEYIGLFLLLVLTIVIGTLIAYVVWISIHPQPPWYGPGWQGHDH
jgi:uncharacterized membrane protein